MSHEFPMHDGPVMDDKEKDRREVEAKDVLGEEYAAAMNPGDNIKFNLREVAEGIHDPKIREALEASIEHHEANKAQDRAAQEQWAEEVRARQAAEKEDEEKKMALRAELAAKTPHDPLKDTRLNLHEDPEWKAAMKKTSLWKKLLG